MLRFFAGFPYSLQVIVMTASSVSHRCLRFLPLTIYDHLPIYSILSYISCSCVIQ